ncbi:MULTISPECIES: integrase core domain-containing protein [unclassified Paenibacillus]|uniref:integrase core domain-containing protein n=1 Tax=unclassified Paenibacillus TaxID=185978 RepID=UPI003850505D
MIRSDNGPQFISHGFVTACESFGVEHERIPPRTPNMNAHIESFHRLLQDECLVRYDFETYSEAYEAVTEFIPAFAICRRLSFMRKTRQNRFRSEKFVYNFKNEISMSKRELVSKLRGLIRELRIPWLY